MDLSAIKNVNNIKYLLYFMIITVIIYFVNTLFIFYINMKAIKYIPPSLGVTIETSESSRSNLSSGDRAMILKRNLFGVMVDESEEIKKEDIINSLNNLTLTSLNLTLIGTITGEEGNAWAIIRDNQTNKQDRYTVGSTIGRAKVVMILRNKVVLNIDGRNELLVMGIEKIKAESPLSGSQITRKQGSFIISKQFLTQSLSNISSLMSQVRIRPYIKNGKPEGFMIRKIKSGSIIEKMGFKDGDVIQSINGKKIVSAEDIIKLYSSMKNANVFSIGILRNNMPETLVFKVQ